MGTVTYSFYQIRRKRSSLDPAAAQKQVAIIGDRGLSRSDRPLRLVEADLRPAAATLYQHLTFQQVRDQNLRVMDPTAITHCMEHDLPILVFNFRKEGNIEKAVRGERVGTLVRGNTNERTSP